MHIARRSFLGGAAGLVVAFTIPQGAEAGPVSLETDSVDARWQRGKHTGRGLRARVGRSGSAGNANSVPDSPLTSGSRPSVIARVSGRPSVSTHDPPGVMPTATTSNRSGSRLRRMLPAETHEMACSELRPP